MNARLIIMLAAAVALVAGVVLLLIPVSATSPGGRSLACGNGFSTTDFLVQAPSRQEMAADIAAAQGRPDLAKKTLLDVYSDACAGSLGVRRGVGFGLAGVGVLGLAGALLVRRPVRQPSVPPTAA
jgi:hypothetical protein